MATPHHKSTGLPTALTSSRVIAKVELDYTRPIVGLAAVHMSAIAGATQVIWYIASDSLGDVPLTPEVTDTILTTPTSGIGGVARTLDVGLALPDAEVYVVMKLDSGTASGVPSLYWSR